MKRFKDFAKEKIPSLSWGGHDTIRDKIRKVKEKIPSLSWGGHDTIRDKSKKHIPESYDGQHDFSDFKDHDHEYTKSDDDEKMYDRIFHDHPDIKPQKLTKEHADSLWAYTSGSKRPGTSININNRLRNKEGDKSVGVRHATEEEVHEATKNLKAVFTPENTNKQPITVHCGLPTHIGEKLKNDSDAYDKGKFQKGIENTEGVKSKFRVPGFQSTSTKESVARNFAGMYNMTSKSKDRHMMRIECPPHVGVSVVNHSTFDDENEMLLHHGLEMHHLGYTRHENHLGGYDYYHSIKAQPIEKAKSLHEYGSYTHPNT